VADAADDGDREAEDRAGHALVVEAPEVLDAAATARDDRDVEVRLAGEQAQSPHEGRCCLLALHNGGRQHQLRHRPPAREHVLDVLQRARWAM
jgi:hypothetical protein